MRLSLLGSLMVLSGILLACSNDGDNRTNLSISGDMSGLSGSVIQLQLNGSETIDLYADGAFHFADTLYEGHAYTVDILKQPSNQICSIANASGTATASVSDISVSCVDESHSVSGTVSGLSGRLQFQLNGAEILEVSTDGNFSFMSTLDEGNQYSLAIVTQPTGQLCMVTNASGTVANNVDDISVNCSNNNYTVQGAISGLNGSIDLQLNGVEMISVSAGCCFVFASTLLHSDAYVVHIVTQPSGQECEVLNDAGTVTVNVSNVSVICADI